MVSAAADGASEPLDVEMGDDPSPAMFRAIAETSVNPFALVDDDGVFRWVGRSIEELLGWRPDEIVGKGMDAIVAPWSLGEVAEAFTELERLPPRSNYPRGGVGQAADLLCRDGTTTPCNLLAATRSQTGLPYHLVFARRAGYEQALDIALEAIAGHAELDEVLEPLVATLQQSIPRCVVAIGDGWEHDRFDVVAGDAVDLLGPGADSPWARALATGEDVVVESLDEMPPSLAAMARARGLVSCWVHPVTVPGDERAAAALVMFRPFDGLPTRLTWRAVHRTGRLLRFTLQWDRSHRALEFAATHDTLTGLANRTAFVARLDEIAKLVEGRAAVLFIDLDRFKPVNDQLGHLAGDKVLQAVAHRLDAAVRPGDLVARIGGDEFAVLCERLVHPSDVETVADRLIAAIAAPVVIDGHEITITGSLGMAELGHHESPDEIIARADQAMREAKAKGPGLWVSHPPA